ncbi:helix-turn-helix transcriptional regulator [Mammaliicoccus sciuri]
MKNINLIQSSEKKKLTQGQLAKMLGYKGKQSVANWENGYTSPPLETGLRISQILEEDISFLFNFEVQDIHHKKGGNEVR